MKCHNILLINDRTQSGKILKFNEMDLIATTIRAGIELFDEKEEAKKDDIETTEGDTEEQAQPSIPKTRKIVGTDHFQLGAALPARTVQEIEDENSANDPMFKNFRKRLGQVFSYLFNKWNIQIQPEHEVSSRLWSHFWIELK